MEVDFVRWLRGHVPTAARLRPGIGDDAAVVHLGRAETVATADLLIDGVHFHSAEHTPERIGHKALAVNLSDLAAMAAEPRAALVSLVLPRGSDPALAERLIQGMLPLADRHDCPIAGGDTNVADNALIVSVAALGEPTDRGVVRRDGARAGDALFVTGPLGGSLSGKHLDFEPRVAEALELARRFDLHAMMDLSDGLSLDLHRMMSDSDVGAEIDAAWVPITAAAHGRAMTSGRSALDHALDDGEDFELLFAVAEEDAAAVARLALPSGPPVRSGAVVPPMGVELIDESGERTRLEPRGFEHR